jgi:hypothetical protein
MNEMRKELAGRYVEEILNDFSKSTKQIISLFGSGKEALERIILPELADTTGELLDLPTLHRAAINPCSGKYRDLKKLTGCNGWKEVIEDIFHNRRFGVLTYIHVGDYLDVPIHVEECEIEGVHFDEVHIQEARAVVVAVSVAEQKVVFNFDNVLFTSPINEHNTNEGGFEKSALGKYLNGPFLDCLGEAKDYFSLTAEGLRISLPTLYEVFGEGKAVSNFLYETDRFEYFKKRKNRIKVDMDDDTMWWWLSSPYSAASADFCGVGGTGGAYYYLASSSGGAAPAFCIA